MGFDLQYCAGPYGLIVSFGPSFLHFFFFSGLVPMVDVDPDVAVLRVSGLILIPAEKLDTGVDINIAMVIEAAIADLAM